MSKNNYSVCGIDISTKVAGVSIINEENELVFWKYYTFKDFQIDTPLQIGFFFRDVILKELEVHSPDYYVLEDRLKGFAGGRTSNTTIMKLAKVNGLVEFVLVDTFGNDVIRKYHPSTARKQSFLGKGSSPKGVDTKDWVVDQTMKKYPELTFPVKTRSRKKPKPFIDEAQDVCDSIVLASSFQI